MSAQVESWKIPPGFYNCLVIETTERFENGWWILGGITREWGPEGLVSERHNDNLRVWVGGAP